MNLPAPGYFVNASVNAGYLAFVLMMASFQDGPDFFFTLISKLQELKHV
jgi:hypothetical protein